MVTRDLVTDLTALLLPLPARPDPAGADDIDAVEEAWSAIEEQVQEQRAELEQQLRLGWDEAGVDPLLGSIAHVRSAMLAAERRMRLLIAYGREFVGPRPYTLDDLARSAGMSISGVRTAYDDDEIADVAARTGARQRRRVDPTTSRPTPAAPDGPSRRVTS